MKVNFMVIGAMKAGTTTLSGILKNHPEVIFATRKEPHFFSKSDNWRVNLEEYGRLFEGQTGKVCGEGSTTYTYYPDLNLELWKDIYEYNPEMKFIYLVRNPVDRAVSQYIHFFERGYLKCSIEEAIREIPVLLNNGRYFTQIKPFIDQFGRDKVLILHFDDLIRRRAELLRDVAGFLGIEFDLFADYEHVHANKSIGEAKPHRRFDGLPTKLSPFFQFIPRQLRRGIWNEITKNRFRSIEAKPELSPEFRRVIINLTQLDILALQELTGRDYAHWLEVEELEKV